MDQCHYRSKNVNFPDSRTRQARWLVFSHRAELSRWSQISTFGAHSRGDRHAIADHASTRDRLAFAQTFRITVVSSSVGAMTAASRRGHRRRVVRRKRGDGGNALLAFVESIE